MIQRCRKFDRNNRAKSAEIFHPLQTFFKKGCDFGLSMRTFSTMRIVFGIYVHQESKSLPSSATLKEISTKIEKDEVPPTLFQYELRLMFFAMITVAFNGVIILLYGLNVSLLICTNLLLVLTLQIVSSIFTQKLDKKLSLLAFRSYKWTLRHRLIEEVYGDPNREIEFENEGNSIDRSTLQDPTNWERNMNKS